MLFFTEPRQRVGKNGRVIQEKNPRCTVCGLTAEQARGRTATHFCNYD